MLSAINKIKSMALMGSDSAMSDIRVTGQIFTLSHLVKGFWNQYIESRSMISKYDILHTLVSTCWKYEEALRYKHISAGCDAEKAIINSLKASAENYLEDFEIDYEDAHDTYVRIYNSLWDIKSATGKIKQYLSCSYVITGYAGYREEQIKDALEYMDVYIPYEQLKANWEDPSFKYIREYAEEVLADFDVLRTEVIKAAKRLGVI